MWTAVESSLPMQSIFSSIGWQQNFENRTPTYLYSFTGVTYRCDIDINQLGNVPMVLACKLDWSPLFSDLDRRLQQLLNDDCDPCLHVNSLIKRDQEILLIGKGGDPLVVSVHSTVHSVYTVGENGVPHSAALLPHHSHRLHQRWWAKDYVLYRWQRRNPWA